MLRPLLTFFWLFGLPILWLLSIWWLLRLPRSGALGVLPPGDSLQVLTAVFTVGAILIAFASYQYANAGQRQLAAVEEHAKTLESQRQALDASRRSLEQTLEASEKSRETHARMLENAKESREALHADVESARQQEESQGMPIRRPRVEFGLGETEWAQLRSGVATKLPHSDGQVVADLVVRNVGNARLVRPTVLVRALPSRVKVTPSQFSGSTSDDIPPARVSGGGVVYSVSASVPDDVQSFVLIVVIYGANLERQTVTMPVQVVRH
jgi:hypothetical protein